MEDVLHDLILRPTRAAEQRLGRAILQGGPVRIVAVMPDLIGNAHVLRIAGSALALASFEAIVRPEMVERSITKVNLNDGKSLMQSVYPKGTK